MKLNSFYFILLFYLLENQMCISVQNCIVDSQSTMLQKFIQIIFFTKQICKKKTIKNSFTSGKLKRQSSEYNFFDHFLYLKFSSSEYVELSC